LALSGAADRYDHREDSDYYSHAGALFRLMNDEQKALLINNIAGAMAGVDGGCRRASVAALLQC
jgi:catalase